MTEKGSGMESEKMLAVRLSPALVEDVQNTAKDEKKSLKAFMREIIQAGLAQSREDAQKRTKKVDDVAKRDVYHKRRKALQSGKLMPWYDKKMLAVRLPFDLVNALNDYALREERNISTLVEEFIYLGLAQKRGEVIDAETLARLTNSSYLIFRRRRQHST